MQDVRTNIRDLILRELDVAAQGEADPRPPSSYFMASIEMMAMSVFEKSHVLNAWMETRGLDPHKGPDAVLGVGLLLAIEEKHHPRPIYEHFDYPDDHDH